MFVNDFGSHYGSQWNVPSFWGGHTPYIYGMGTVPQNIYGMGTVPQNIYGMGGNFPYHHNTMGTQHTGWNHGQTMPQTTMTQPFHGYNYGLNYPTFPYNYWNQTQSFTPYWNQTQGFTPYTYNFQTPFQHCR